MKILNIHKLEEANTKVPKNGLVVIKPPTNVIDVSTDTIGVSSMVEEETEEDIKDELSADFYQKATDLYKSIKGQVNQLVESKYQLELVDTITKHKLIEMIPVNFLISKYTDDEYIVRIKFRDTKKKIIIYLRMNEILLERYEKTPNIIESISCLYHLKKTEIYPVSLVTDHPPLISITEAIIWGFSPRHMAIPDIHNVRGIPCYDDPIISGKYLPPERSNDQILRPDVLYYATIVEIISTEVDDSVKDAYTLKCQLKVLELYTPITIWIKPDHISYLNIGNLYIYNYREDYVIFPFNIAKLHLKFAKTEFEKIQSFINHNN